MKKMKKMNSKNKNFSLSDRVSIVSIILLTLAVFYLTYKDRTKSEKKIEIIRSSKLELRQLTKKKETF
ncbi:hypothetical protein [Flavobacterium columnare]|uniref:hypothetical protein n=1 Tax=Flavobacterium columnare TaxID=996 RepID=UPI000F5084B1|nr:hypothetical protein [Flavobacterium columnare]